MPPSAMKRKPAMKCCIRAPKKKVTRLDARPNSVVNSLKKSIKPYQGLSKVSSPAQIRRKIADKSEAGAYSEAVTAHEGARCHAQDKRADVSGAVSNLSKDCSRLPVSNGSLQSVLPDASNIHEGHTELGPQPHNILSTVFQRWHGVVRSNKILGSSDGQFSGSQCKAYASSGPQSIERMEEPGPRQKSSTFAMAFDSVDCVEHAGDGTQTKCHGGTDDVRGLYQTNRNSEVAGKGLSEFNLPCCHLDASVQSFRGVRDIQNGHGGRKHHARLQGSAMVGKSSSEDVSTLSAYSDVVASRICKIPRALESSIAHDRVAQGAQHTLSAAALRSKLGSFQKLSLAAGSEDAGTMGIRFLHGQVREEGIDFDSLRCSPCIGASQVSQCSAVSSKQGPRHFGPMKDYKGYSLELFSGTARVSKVLAKHGWHSEAWDILYGPTCDLTDVNRVNSILDRIRRGEIQYVHIGLPCNSWSRARRFDNRGPGPLRDDSKYLMGFPGLNAVDKRKVQLGNFLLQQSVRVIRACQQSSVPWTLENPMTSRVWLTRHIKALKYCHFQRADFCQYGLPWRKATYFLCSNLIHVAFKTCSGPSRLCSRTHAPHIILQGSRNGVFLTKLAEPYPWMLVHSLVTAATKMT